MGNQQKKITITPQHQKVIELVGKEIERRFDLGEETEVSITFVDNQMIQGLNREYRGIDQPTDVLSFAFDDDVEGDMMAPVKHFAHLHMLGEIVLSLEKVKKQAEEYEHSFFRELAFLTVHGMLHLLGYDHQEEQDTKEMRIMEEEILNSLPYPRNI